ncbi:MAG: hypothetical protein RL660_315 [Bacteroidota bacterium]|jgi:hypothetical protein
MLKSALRFFSKCHIITKVSLFVAGLVLINLLLFASSKLYFDRAVRQSLVSYNHKDSILYKSIMSDTATSSSHAYLKNMFLISNNMRQSYLDVAINFNVFQLAYTISMFYCGLVLGVLSFLVIKRGWDHTDNIFIKVGFLYFSAATTLFSMMPKVFDNENNIRRNFEKATYHFSLGMDINSLIKNMGTVPKDSAVAFKKEIMAVAWKIKSNQELFFDIQQEQIPSAFGISDSGTAPTLPKIDKK